VSPHTLDAHIYQMVFDSAYLIISILAQQRYCWTRSAFRIFLEV